jgi:signal transduction histidine kinase/CheY-like chemotaxis protein/HPt (histidine-containing phosphotransfer) domain-containing protein
LLAGTASVLVLAILSAFDAGGMEDLFRILYVAAVAVSAAGALLHAARRPAPALRFGPLAGAVFLAGLGMLVQEIVPPDQRGIGFLTANSMFTAASVLGFWVIMPALYRHLDRRHLTMTALDGGILWAGGATLMLTIWRTGGMFEGPDVLLAPILAAAMLASAGAAAAAAFARRWAPALSGIWCGIVGVALIGLSWTVFVDSALHGRPSGQIGSLLYASGILFVTYGWTTWTDETFDEDRYEVFARRLADWLPMAAVLVCITATALPHAQIASVDVTWAGTMLVVLLTLARQMLLIGGERETSQRLVGEERLRAEKEAAEASDRAKSEFLAMMSHEIRTPMNAILGNARLLADTPLSDDARESVEAIGIAGETLLSIINDILDFSKIEARSMQLERRAFPVAELIRSVVSLFTSTAHDKGLTIAAEIDAALPEYLAGDAHRLRQILFNLTGNAIKFTSRGGVTLRAHIVQTGTESSLLRFEVADTGIGISPAARARLFAPFVQADDSTTRRFGGTGLGLAISRNLVRLMEGEIGVESVEGSGSTFWFTARLGTPTQIEVMAAQAVDEEPTISPECVGARVLVVEDNPANLRLVERLLGQLGIESLTATNGRMAVTRVLSEDIDLVLMDLHMPEMDGMAATRAIRAAGTDIPIIALTADATVRDRAECLAIGMNDYLSKPIRQASLVAALREWLPAVDRPQDEDELPNAPMPFAAALTSSVLDPAQVEELVRLDPGGEAGFLAEMVDSYHATLAETMPGIRDAIERGDPRGLEDAAHKLKGVSGNIGAAMVFDASRRLVDLARSGSLDGATSMLADLEASLPAAAEALDELLAAFARKPEAA